MDTIKVSCWRQAGWPQISSADLAAAISAPYAIRRMELVEFFGSIAAALAQITGGSQAQAAGMVAAETARLYQAGRFLDDLEYQLRNLGGQTNAGNYAAVLYLVQTAQTLTTLSEAMLTAIQTVITASTLRLVDVVAAELGEPAPGEVSAGMVDEGLGR